jgi:hypothetical protein
MSFQFSNRCLSLLLTLSLMGCSSIEQKSASVTFAAEKELNKTETWKPRVINTTDLGADPDDKQSMVRQFVMANEFDIEGLIVTTGCWLKTQKNTQMLDQLVDAYDAAYPNLRIHADGFPTPDYLRSISVMGQLGYGMDDVGDGKDSPGSELIIKAADREDPRPLWVTCWGGCNTLAQALWKVKQTRSNSELEKFASKLRVYDVLGQDNAGTWIAKNFPSIVYIRATDVFDWQPSEEYLTEHIQSHGVLGSAYPDTKYKTEGDTPAFMYLANPGLNDPEKVSHGGWGGRFESEKQTAIRGMSCMKGEDDVFDPYEMYGNPVTGSEIKRWKQGYDNDFQARMDWSVQSDYADANHHPVAVLNGDSTKSVTYMTSIAGSHLTLSAVGSSDPDGNSLSYNWFYYPEASSYSGTVEIEQVSAQQVKIDIPQDAKGREVHIILTVKDAGVPSLHAYRRAVIQVE